MVDPIELTTQQWDFISQLIILGIAAIIAAKMVPYFTNQYQEKQVKTDRTREDKRQQLAIQHEMIERVTKSMVEMLFYIMIPEDIKFGKQKITPSEQDFKKIILENLVNNQLFILYYGVDSEIKKSYTSISSLHEEALEYVIKEKNNEFTSESRRESVELILKKSGSKLSFESALKEIEAKGFDKFFESLNSQATVKLSMDLYTTLPKIN